MFLDQSVLTPHNGVNNNTLLLLTSAIIRSTHGYKYLINDWYGHILILYLQFDPLDIVSKKPHTVVLMLDSPEEHVLQSACEALYKFAEKCKLDRLSFIFALLFIRFIDRNICGMS